MRNRRNLLIGLIAIIALLVFFLFYAGRPSQSSLAEYRKQLLAHGEKLTIAEITPHVTAAEGANARNLITAIGPLGSSPSDYPPPMRVIVPSHAMIAWAQETLPSDSSTNIWPNITQRIKDHRGEIADIRAALKNTDTRFDLAYGTGFSLALPHLSQLKGATVWLSTAALVELHEGHPSNALDDLESCMAVTKPLELEPVIISQLVRVAGASIAISTTWELLQYPGWQDAQLAELQAQWNSVNLFARTAPALEMYRAMMPSDYMDGRTSYSNFNAIVSMGITPPPTWGFSQPPNAPKNFQYLLNNAVLYFHYWAWKENWSYAEERYDLQVAEAGIDCARSVGSSGVFGPASKKFDADFADIRNSFAHASNYFCFNFGASTIQSFLRKMADMEMARRMTVTAIALKRFQLRTGKYPADLKELVPEYLPEVPMDFMDGQPLRYHTNTNNTFLLYSVGEDGEDDGGDPTPPSAGTSIYNAWWKGRDAVWPTPATPDETRTYLEKLVAGYSAKQEFNNPITNSIVKTNNSSSTTTN